MNRVVVLQPQFFPWRGVFEQIRLAECYVHFDDVALPQGRSFVSRVQIKTQGGPQWLTVPVRKGSTLIQNVLIDESRDWRQNHLKTLQNTYARAPFLGEMLDIVKRIYSKPCENLCELNISSIESIAHYLGLRCAFHRSSALPSSSTKVNRLVEIASGFGAATYLTGHGALNYLEPEPFERAGVQVEIMDYRRTPYPQLHGDFDPHVSILDLIANHGRASRFFLDSPSESWRVYERQRQISA